MSEDVTDKSVEEVLEAVTDDHSADAEDSSTEEKAQVEETPKESRGKGAKDRIQELLAKNKSLEEEFSKTKETLTERESELGKLVDLLQARDNDAQVVKAINDLYNSDPESRPFIEYLDKLIKGEEVEAKPTFKNEEGKKQSAEKSAEDLVSKIEEKLNRKSQEFETRLTDHRNNLIMDEADKLTDYWMDELPPEYGDEDKELISKALVVNTDWDAIEDAEGENLEEELAKGMKATLEWYGKPKGLTQENNKVENKEDTREQALDRLRGMIDKDWSKVSEVERGGKKIIAPVATDADFTKVLAQAMREGHKLDR